MSIRVTIVFPQACWRDKDAEKKSFNGAEAEGVGVDGSRIFW